MIIDSIVSKFCAVDTHTRKKNQSFFLPIERLFVIDQLKLG